MVIRKSNFVSICLLALATTVALTEYISYTPSSVQDSFDSNDDGLFNSDDEKNSDEEKNSDDEKNIDDKKNIDDEKNIDGIDNFEKKDPLTDSSQINEQPTNGNLATTQSEGGPKEEIKQSEKISEISIGAPKNYTVSLQNGQNLPGLLTTLGIPKKEAHLASKAASTVVNIRNLKIGEEVLVNATKHANGLFMLNFLEIKINFKHKLLVKNVNGKFSASKIELPLKKVARNISGTFHPNLFEKSFSNLGIKTAITHEALKAISYIVNVKKSRKPVNFEILYNDYYDSEGNVVGKPEFNYISVLVDGRIHRVYKFRDENRSEYVDSNGIVLGAASGTKSMLIQPICYTKITSKFGIRRHPISGQVKGHTGIDISARVGTPVRAAASGVIVKAGRYSGYGNYIKIGHTGAVNTAYGHLSRVVVRNGQRVSQGQIIGYTGNSGYSTGPHLHYEVIKSGNFINPVSLIKQHNQQKLTGPKLSMFSKFKKQVNLQVVGLTPQGVKKKFS